MIRIRKGLSLLLVIMLVFTFGLTGCKKSEDTSKDVKSNTSDTVDSQEENKEPEEKEEKPYHITWYSIGGPQKDTEMVFEELSKYTKEKINATIEMTQFDWGDYDKKMKVIISSGQPFDICFTCSWANDYILNSSRGAFVALDELLDKYGKGTKEAVHPLFWEGAKVNGHIYAVPSNKELGWSAVWRFNKKYLDQYDLDISNVETLESLEPLLKVIKEKEQDIQPLAMKNDFCPYLPFDYVMGEQLPFGVYLDGSKGLEVVNTYETPEFMSLLETMHKYYNAGYIRTDAATVTNADYDKTGKWFADKAHTQPCGDLLWSRGYGYDVISTPMHTPFVNTSSCTGSMQAISVTSENPDKAMMFLELLNTDPYVRNMVDSGIEGIHYEMIDGRQKDLKRGTDQYNMPSFSLGNLFITNLYVDDPADRWEQFNKFNNAAIKAPTLGFSFDIDPVKTECTALKNVVKEFQAILFTGSVDPHEFVPKALEKMKAAGSEKVKAEIQKQVDEWKANK